jgi:hypothetical protein
LELLGVSFPSELSPGLAFPYSFTIQNTGFGRLTTARRGYLVLHQVVAEGDMHTIAVDGDTAEWSAVTDAVVDAQSDAAGAVADVHVVSVANDEDFVYIRVSFHSVTVGKTT